MSIEAMQVSRRRFLKTAFPRRARRLVAPTIIPSSALGGDGAVAPSERMIVGGIGIGNRGTYDLGCFLEQKDVQFAAVCDVKERAAIAVKKHADELYGNQSCLMFRDFRELLDRNDIDAVLIATGPNWHATMAMQAAKAGKDMYCEKPCTKNIAQSLILRDTMRRTGRVFQVGTQRRNLPHFAFACELARTGKLGKLKKVYAHPARMQAHRSAAGFPPSQSRTRTSSIGTCTSAPRPGGRTTRSCSTASISRRAAAWLAASKAGKSGGGVLEWGSHCVDLCQWAVDDCPPPIEYNPPENGQIVCKYAKRRRADLPRERLDSAGLVPGAVRRRDRLGRSGRQRQDRAQLARVARGPNGRRNRRLSGDVPCSRLPRLREDPQQDQGKCRSGLQRPHRLPRGEHRAVLRIAR